MAFKLLDSRQVFSGRVFNLTKETWRGPNEKTFERQTIVHPGAVGMVPFKSARKLILIRQFRPAVRKELLEIPAGTIEAGERPLVCAKRELAEEIGFAARKWKKLGTIYSAPGFCSERLVLYKAWDLSPSYAEKDEDEHIDAVEMSMTEVKSAVTSGKICDAKTLSALLLLGWLK